MKRILGQPRRMEDYIYRFRSARALLENYQELQKQSIYFAKLEELNDPMEGFKDIFWSGDDIVWGNLFRHYIQCMAHAFFFLCIAQEEHDLTWDMIPVLDARPERLTDELRVLHDEALSEVLSQSELSECVQRIAARVQPVRRNELEFYLRNVHELAVPCVARVFARRKVHPPFLGVDEAIENAKSKLAKVADSVHMVNLIEEGSSSGEHASERLFASLNEAMKQVALIDKYNGIFDASKRNSGFVFLSFPEQYVRNIERLVYPEWYTACFSKDFHNSAVWGTYGDRHQGVCLKFRVKKESEWSGLTLNRVCGWSSVTGATKGDVPHPLLPVTYQSKFVAIDFFRSLGGVSAPVLNRDWHRSQDGRVSICDFGGDFSEEKRDDFWKAFMVSATTKLKDWEYEQEYRLVLYGNILDFSDKADRVANYDFADLEGIIFGLNTTDADKLAIMKIIDEKCQQHQREDFKFYQAYYEHATGRIEATELGHLKVILSKVASGAVSA
ncbi:DUF2971 domain-containing protein [Dyella sp. C9]|uniref:DUF2971 domain-containing protein n=1 Tax=Dyella sp. C9 TaxID=2202154 RepID=UPI000DEF44F6|nr:DUF2971 domain-containing protein [Dyella sp. C9]